MEGRAGQSAVSGNRGMSEYSYYLKISVKDSAVGANETNFPVALVMTDSALATVANGGNIANVDNSGGASGSLTVPADFEVRTDPHDSSTALDFEVVDYTASTGYIEFWIELDSLSSSSGADVYICFGNPRVTTSQEDVSGTWGNGFAGVWHLGEGGGTAYDSTGTQNAADNASATGTTGQVGDGQALDGSDDYYDLGTAQFTSGDFTLETWCNFDLFSGSINSLLAKYIAGVAAVDGEWVLWDINGNGKLSFYIRDNSSWYTVTDPDAMGTGTWYHIAAVWDGTTQTLYRDANDKDNDTPGITSRPSCSTDVYIGASPDDSSGSTDNFDGFLDEVRISDTGRDADWISTAYENQDNPSPDGAFWSALGSKTRMRRGPIGVAPLLMA